MAAERGGLSLQALTVAGREARRGAHREQLTDATMPKRTSLPSRLPAGHPERIIAVVPACFGQ